MNSSGVSSRYIDQKCMVFLVLYQYVFGQWQFVLVVDCQGGYQVVDQGVVYFVGENVLVGEVEVGYFGFWVQLVLFEVFWVVIQVIDFVFWVVVEVCGGEWCGQFVVVQVIVQVGVFFEQFFQQLLGKGFFFCFVVFVVFVLGCVGLVLVLFEWCGGDDFNGGVVWVVVGEVWVFGVGEGDIGEWNIVVVWIGQGVVELVFVVVVWVDLVVGFWQFQVFGGVVEVDVQVGVGYGLLYLFELFLVGCVLWGGVWQQLGEGVEYVGVVDYCGCLFFMVIGQVYVDGVVVFDQDVGDIGVGEYFVVVLLDYWNYVVGDF